MTYEDRIKSILTEIDYDYIGYDNLHGDNNQGLQIIEDALKKQIPEKPIVREDGWIFWDCPSCGTPLEFGNGCANNNCRQAIDWSKE